MSQEERSGPLAGVSVVELAGIGPTPFAGMMLRQLGASVTRIERPGGLDSVIPIDRDPINAGKRSVTLDLKGRGGTGRLLEMLADADILIEGHRPGVLERLGLEPELLLERHPRLVIGRMTGWGQDGPLAQSAGHDLNYISLTGALHAIGKAGGVPQIPLNLVGDYGGGALYLVVGVLAALHEVGQGGTGQVVDAAIVDGAAHLLSGVHSALSLGLWRDERGANFMDGGTPFYAVYATADGEHMAVTAVEAPFYAEFVRLLGVDAQPSRQHERGDWPRLRTAIAAAFAAGTQAEWTAIFAGSDACVSPVLGLRRATEHPHIAARGTITMVDGQPRASAAPRFSRPHLQRC